MSEDISTAFQTGLAHFGLQDREPAFLRYREELLEWNSRFNLTAIKDPEEVLIKHFLDSLTLLESINQHDDTPKTLRLLDIGTGPGFPGLPLKIAHPEWHVTLIEATGKKTTFLRHIADVLHLQNVEILHGRAEEFAHQKAYREHFDIVTARAVSALPVLLECSAPYCRQGGIIIIPKKGELSDELAQGQRAASKLGTRFLKDSPITLPDLNDGRRLLLWQQQKPCSPQYPRSWSAMAKNR